MFERNFPLVRQSRARQKDKKWFTQGIKKSIIHKNRLLQRKIKRPTPYNIQTLKNYNNVLQQCMKSAENKYYLDEFNDKHESNFKFWKTFSTIINPNKKKKSETIKKLNYNNDILTDNIAISVTFELFYNLY